MWESMMEGGGKEMGMIYIYINMQILCVVKKN